MRTHVTLRAAPAACDAQKLAFYMPAICSYTMLLTVYYVPYTTIIMELSDDPAERDTATTWRMCDKPSRPTLRL